jgi:protein-L-isoaspartate(D-aspartate) O-methyltransferase
VTSPFNTGVQAALDTVDEDTYTTSADGTRVRQSSSPRIIATMLDLLQVEPGMRVLEIGTGTGYSTALLTELTGMGGHVTSIDIDPALTTRARQLLHADGRTNTTLLTGDGRDGAPELDEERFHRVIAWTTVDELPTPWVSQAAPEALIVAPVNLTDLPKTHAIVRARNDNASGGLAGETIIAGGFVEACDQVLDQWLIPPRGVDALIHDDTDHPWWLSADWLRDGNDDQPGQHLLKQLMLDPHKVPGPLTCDEDGADFYAYLLATRPSGLTTAALGDPTWRIGATTPTSAALIPAGDGHDAIHTGGSQALGKLLDWADHWRAHGRPGYTDVRPHLAPGKDGWTVHAAL